MSMNGATTNTSGVGRGGTSIRRVHGPVNGVSSDACGGE